MRIRELSAVAAVVIFAAGCGSTRVVTIEQKPKPAPRAQTFPELVARVRTGIVRIEVVTCAGEDIGTGFLIGNRLVATVDHVVDGAVLITLKQNGKVVAQGTVVGADQARDLALVRTDRPVPGYHFHLADNAPQLGEDVAAIGFPLGLPLTPVRGTVTGSDRTIPFEGINRRDLIQTDTPVNPGNSGGPLISIESGKVVGLVDLLITQANGLAFAVSAKVASPLLAAWRASPQPITPASCSSPQAAPPTTQTTTSSPPPTYRGRDFTIDYPTGWSISHIAEPGHNVDVTFTAPGEPDLLMRVDENTAATGLTAQQSAAPVLASLRRQSSYTELNTSHEIFAGLDAFRWEFKDVEQGTLMHKVDLFLVDPTTGIGWAILVQAPDTEWAQDASAFNSYVQSFQETGG